MELMLPELIVIGTAFAVLLLDLFLKEHQRKVLAPLALVGITCAFFTLMFGVPMSGSSFGGRFEMDVAAFWFKTVFLITAFLTVAVSLDMLDQRAKVRDTAIGSRGEYYTVLLFTVSGMMFLISARDIITLFVSLELATIPLFVLSAWKKTRKSGEAGLKYVILGALASSLLLYGLGFIYALSGKMGLTEISAVLKPSPLLWIAIAMIASGVGFKLTMVPFHMWAADVYEGSPTPITAYLSVASKAAGLAFMFQIFFRVLGWHPGSALYADPTFVTVLNHIIAIMAAVTMTLGNLVAIVQQNIKRFMAFSAISQAGYLLMGFLGPVPQGVTAMLFYLLVYAITNIAVFAVIIHFYNETGLEMIEDYRGLSRTNPMLSLAMMLALFSLAGIPPLSGFVGKFFLFSIAAQNGFHWLVGVAAVNSTISLYYYLRIIRQMYIEHPLPNAKPLGSTPALAMTITATTVVLVLLGIIPMFYELINSKAKDFLSLLM